MKIDRFFIFWLLILGLIFAGLDSGFRVRAVEVTNTAKVGTPSPSEESSTESASPTEEGVQEIRDAVKEKVIEKIQEIKDKIEKKGYVGILKEMTDSTLTLETLTGEKMVTVDEGATVVGANKKIVKVNELEIDQKLICMGSLDENKILVAKRIVVVVPPKTASPVRTAFIGRLAEINSKTKTLTLNHLKKLSEKYLVIVDRNTDFSTGDFEDLKTDQVLIVISSRAKENETPTALLIKPLVD